MAKRFLGESTLVLLLKVLRVLTVMPGVFAEFLTD